MGELATVPGEAIEAGALARLEQHAVYAAGAYATNTERALRADVAIFTAWCTDAGLPFLPADPDTLTRFIDAKAAERAPAMVRRYVSSVASFHRAAGLPSPADAQQVKLALRRMHREKGRAQNQAAPLTRQLVDRMLGAAGDRLLDLRNKALLGTAYDTLCRRSELAELRFQDLEDGPDGTGTILVRRSKTDQEGAGMIRLVGPDTLRDLRAWLEAAGVTEGPIFRAVSRSGVPGVALSGYDVVRIFKAMALAAGIDPEAVQRISGHSSRVGAAQDMVRHGIELPAVMQAGGWRTSEMVSRYTRRLDARRGGTAQLMQRQGRM